MKTNFLVFSILIFLLPACDLFKKPVRPVGTGTVRMQVACEISLGETMERFTSVRFIGRKNGDGAKVREGSVDCAEGQKSATLNANRFPAEQVYMINVEWLKGEEVVSRYTFPSPLIKEGIIKENEGEVKPPSPPKLKFPLELSTVNSSRPRINWDANDNMEIELDYKEDFSTEGKISGMVKNTEWSPSADLTKGKYYLRIRINSEDSLSFWSKTRIFKVDTSIQSKPPELKKIVVNDGAISTDKNQISVGIEATDADDGVAGFYITEESEDEPTDDGKWREVRSKSKNYQETVSYFLSSGKGKKSLRVWVKDTAGNFSNMVTESIEITNEDTNIPVIKEVVVNDGAGEATEVKIQAAITGDDDTGISAVIITEAAETPSANDPKWKKIGGEPKSYEATVEYNLSSGNGKKLVNIYLMDTAGNISAGVSKEINLNTDDNTVPMAKGITINDGAGETKSIQVKVNIQGEDNLGIAGYYLSEAEEKPTLASEGWRDVNPPEKVYDKIVDFNLSEMEGEKTVYVWFRDGAGNVSGEIQSVGIRLKKDDPTRPEVTIPAAPTSLSTTVGDGTVTLTWNTVSAATSYNIYWRTSSGVTKGNGVKITGATSPYTHPNLTNGSTYYYVVTAMNGYGESADSNEASATPQAAVLPPVDSDNLVLVSGGCFQMGDTFGGGDSDEKPVHNVCLDNFYIGKYEVTQKEWKDVMGSNPSFFSSCGDNCPVENVSWNDIQTFIQNLNQKTGRTYRLPTEAEWEYAARSRGKNEKYAGTSNDTSLGEYAWNSSNSNSTTHPVGQKNPNGLGLFDMSGNVWEWVNDWYGSYSSGSQNNPQGPASGSFRVLRGGSWTYNWAGDLRSSYRYGNDPRYRGGNFGFRLARSPQAAVMETNKMSIPDTGQTQSYTSTFGEDHDYSVNPPSYTDNGNGTVTDNVTDLMWQREDDNTKKTWADAGTYCDTLNHAGYSDWRLPSKKELITIVNYGRGGPATDSTYFPNTNSFDYWSSTINEDNLSFAWDVEFGAGFVVGRDKSLGHYVRCVRMDQPQIVKSFTDNNNGTITDNSSGLIWQKEDDNLEKTWEDAITYCENSSLAGFTDWKLPNIKELESITDDTKKNPAIDITYFPNTNASLYWSSTTHVGSPNAWIVPFGPGYINGYDKSSNAYVRCVRQGQ